MRNTKKILIVLKNYDGGTGTFAKLFKQGAIAFNFPWHVEIACLQKPEYDHSGSIYINYIYSKRITKKYHVSNLIINLYGEFVWLNKVIRSYRPNIVISVDSHSIFLVSIIQRYSRKISFQHVPTIHNNIEKVLEKKLSSNWLQKLYKVIFNKIFEKDGVVCISHDLAESVKNYLNLSKKPHVIYYGIFPLQSFRKQKITDGKSMNIGTAMRFEEQKDWLTLIKALNLLKAKKIDFKAILFGDGSEKSKVLELIKRYHLNNRIQLYKWNNNPWKTLRHCDYFVLSSHWEGLSYVILESLHNRQVVIASDCDFGPREILANGKFGILFEPGNEYQLAHILKSVNNQKSKQKFQKQATLRSKDFHIERQLKRYQQLFNINSKQQD